MTSISHIFLCFFPLFIRIGHLPKIKQKTHCIGIFAKTIKRRRQSTSPLPEGQIVSFALWLCLCSVTRIIPSSAAHNSDTYLTLPCKTQNTDISSLLVALCVIVISCKGRLYYCYYYCQILLST